MQNESSVYVERVLHLLRRVGIFVVPINLLIISMNVQI